MHLLATKEIALLCQRRADGSCELPVSCETLEGAVIELWNMLILTKKRLQIALDPEDECEAGILHWEAPNNLVVEQGDSHDQAEPLYIEEWGNDYKQKNTKNTRCTYWHSSLEDAKNAVGSDCEAFHYRRIDPETGKTIHLETLEVFK